VKPTSVLNKPPFAVFPPREKNVDPPFPKRQKPKKVSPKIFGECGSPKTSLVGEEKLLISNPK